MTESNHQLSSKISPLTPTPSEEETNEHNPHLLTPYYDNDVINSLFIRSVDHGSMSLDSSGVVLERTSIILTLEPCQKALIQAIKAAKKGFSHFKIAYRNDNLEVSSTWIFHEPHIRAISFGTENNEDDLSSRKVQIEINYTILEVDGVKL